MSFFPETQPGLPQPYISIAGTNAFVFKASPGILTALATDNNGSAEVFLRLYDLARNPVVGTDVPKWIVGIPTNTLGGGNNPSLGNGLQFLVGIAIAITANRALTDATAIAGGSVCVNVGVA